MKPSDPVLTFREVRRRAELLELGATLEISREEKQSLRGMKVSDLTEFGFDQGRCEAAVCAIFLNDNLTQLFGILGVLHKVLGEARQPEAN